MIGRSIYQAMFCLAFVVVANYCPYAVADELSYFYVVSSDNNGLYQIASSEHVSTRLIGFVNEGTDLYELVDVGSELITLDRATERIITLDKQSADVVAIETLDTDVFITRRGLDANSSGTIYGIFEGNQLRTVDPKSGATQLVATITGAERVEAIAFGPGDELFAVGSFANDSNAENLYSLDIKTGQLTFIGLTGFNDVDTLTLARDGYLFGVDANSGVESILFRISPIDGMGVEEVPTGVFAVNGIEFVNLDFILGDINGDGETNLLDVQPFIDLIVTDPFMPAADINQDGVVDLLDVAPFVEILQCG